MFEKFTDRARRVLVLTQEAARLLEHNFVGTEHLLLGLIHEGEGVAAKALERLGIDMAAAYQAVTDTVPAAPSLDSSPPFSPQAKRVLESSLRESMALGHHYIGTEHLLLALVRESDTEGARLLVRMGADPSQVRAEVMRLLSGHAEAPGHVEPSGWLHLSFPVKAIIVTGSVRVRQEAIDEAVRISLEHVERSRAEPGCIEHGVYRDVQDALRLFFYERWTDRAALDVHFAVPASGEFVNQLSALATEPPSIDIHEVG